MNYFFQGVGFTATAGAIGFYGYNMIKKGNGLLESTTGWFALSAAFVTIPNIFTNFSKALSPSTKLSDELKSVMAIINKENKEEEKK